MTDRRCSPQYDRAAPSGRRRVFAIGITIGAVIVAAGTIAACGSGGAGAAVADDEDLRLSEVWTRPTAPGADTTAFYVTITNASNLDDEVVGVESPQCSMAELHVSTSDDEVMSMSPAGVDDLQVPSAGRLTLEPGGLHIMCMGLERPVVGGDEVEMTVHFEHGEAVTARVSVENR